MTSSKDFEKSDSSEKKSRKKSTSGHHKSRSQSIDRYSEGTSDSKEERKERRNLISLMTEKNEQIDKLIRRVTTLQSLNNQFASEHEKLQKQLYNLEKQCETFEEQQRSFVSNEQILKEEQELLFDENQGLQSDIKMMKMLIYRLNVQLERYQEVLRKKNISISDGSVNISHISSCSIKQRQINWGSMGSNLLAPLLNAYQETVNEKSELIQQYEIELNEITGRIKDLIKENDRLHEEMDILRRNNETSMPEKARLEAQLEICRNKAEIHSKRADLAKEKLIEVIRSYEQKIQAQHIDIERLQEVYARAKGELTSFKNMSQQPEVIVESLKECQRLFEELKTQHNQQKTASTDEISGLKMKLEESGGLNQKCQSEITVLKKSLESYDQKNHKLRQRLMQIRQTRDILKDRLKSTISWNKNIETAIRVTKNISWQDLHKIEKLLAQKEVQIQKMHQQHLAEIEQLNRKLNHREETLKKILMNKVKSIKK